MGRESRVCVKIRKVLIVFTATPTACYGSKAFFPPTELLKQNKLQVFLPLPVKYWRKRQRSTKKGSQKE